MAQDLPFKRLLDAGIAFTAMTRARAEEIIGELVKNGEVQAAQAQKAAEDLVERSRKNTEAFLEQVRADIEKNLVNMRLASRDDIARLEKRIATLTNRGQKAVSSAPAAAAKKASSASKSAKKAVKKATKKAPAKKAARTVKKAAKKAVKKSTR